MAERTETTFRKNRGTRLSITVAFEVYTTFYASHCLQRLPSIFIKKYHVVNSSSVTSKHFISPLAKSRLSDLYSKTEHLKHTHTTFSLQIENAFLHSKCSLQKKHIILLHGLLSVSLLDITTAFSSNSSNNTFSLSHRSLLSISCLGRMSKNRQDKRIVFYPYRSRSIFYI